MRPLPPCPVADRPPRGGAARRGVPPISYRAILELASDPISIRDEDGWFIDANEAAQRMLGYTHEEYLSLHVTDIAPPEANPGLDARMVRLKAGATIVGVRHLRRKDGTLVEGENSSQLLPGGLILTISRDLTERRRQDEERQRLVTAVDQTAEAIAMVDTNGVVTWVNPAFARLHGVAAHEIAGRDPSEFFHPIAPDDTSSTEITAAMAAGEPWAGWVRRRRSDGRLVDLDLSISPIHGEDGRVVGWVEIGRDVGRERALEEQLRQAQKMEAVGRLAGGIAHDFNNLLAAVSGFAELIRGDAAPGGELDEMSGEIMQAAERGKSLAARLLAFARPRGDEPAAVDLGRLVEGAAPILGQVADERAKLTLDLAREPLPVFVDPVLLEQALLNLVINSRDAIAGMGAIVVSTRPEAVGAGHRAAEAGLAPGAYARLSVADTGTGIAPEAIPRLFEPFFSTKPQNRGTGLGLSIVYSVVTAAGGRVLVDSAPGAGARFDVFLPLVEAAELEAEDRTAAVPPVAPGAGPLLVVDDEPMILAIVERMLTKAGHEVVTAASAEAALEMVDGGVIRPAVLVTDVLLPAMSGLALAAELRGRLPGLPVLFISGYEGDRVAGESAHEAGLYLQKPFRAADLIRWVSAALDGVPPGEASVTNR